VTTSLLRSNVTVTSAWTLVVLPVCFVLSGFAGIVYQIAWARQFALVFGTTEVAVTLVLAAYMAGLGLGAWLVQRFLPFVERPVRVYAMLELVIGASAIALVPAVIAGSDWLQHSLAGQRADLPASEELGWIPLLYASSAFVALVIPTLCMGATLPLLTRQVVQSDRQTGRRVGLLFTSNTIGAVAGALLATYWILPSLGLTRTVWSAAAINFLAAMLALTVSQTGTRRRTGFSAAWAAASRATFSRPPAPVWILPLMLLSGAVALCHEILWTRLLSHVLGSSLQAFGSLLAGFLGGLALGAAVGSAFTRDRRAAVAGFVVAEIGCAISAAATYLLIGRLPDNTLAAAAVTVPIAFFCGATFPLAVRILAKRAEDAASATARVYAWNTLGAILGALVGGFVLIPALRFEGSIQLAVAASALLAVAAVCLLERASRTLAITASVLALGGLAAFWPSPPTALLRASPLKISSSGRMLYYAVGRSSSVVVLEQDGSLAFRTNGLPEALVEVHGAAPHVSGEKWLLPLAVLSNANTDNLLLVGYGGGVVLEDVPEGIKHIDVIEIEPRVIDANQATRGFRKREPLADGRVRVVINDARSALNLTQRRYDAIVSQPSHPWTAAASHLYTREFMLQARAHLTDNGVFVQWMNISFMDDSLLRSFAATVLGVFADAKLYRPDPYTLIFVASKGADHYQPPAGNAFPAVGINTPEDILVALAADGQALRRLSRGAPIVTDDRNRMATGSARQTGNSLTLEATDRLLAPVDPLRLPNPAFQRSYMARRLAMLAATDPGARDRLIALANATDPQSQTGYEVNAVRLEADGDRDAAQDMIQQGLARFPDSDNLRYEYIQPWLTRLARGTASKEVTAQAAKLTHSAGAVVSGTVLASQHRWAELRDLDDSLSEATWRDPWKLDAILLQVQWRCQAEAPADIRRQRGDEALALIDQAVSAQPAIVLYALRVQSALAARRSDAVVESIWEYGHGLFTGSTLDHTQIRAALQELLLLLSQQTSADSVRAEEVRLRLVDDIRELAK
jgi:spermidine synthase